jgi:hypothetical protein
LGMPPAAVYMAKSRVLKMIRQEMGPDGTPSRADGRA